MTTKFPTHIVAGAGFVENEEGKILMVKTHNSKWVFPGGQVEEGESIPEAIVREVKEESGIDCEVIKLVSVISNTGSYTNSRGTYIPTKVMFDFICKHTGGELGTSDETTHSGWFTVEEAYNLISVEAYQERFKAYLNYKNQACFIEYKTKPEFNLISKRNI